MRHQPKHEKAGAPGTRLIAASLVLIVVGVSLAAVTLPVEHRPTAHNAQERHGRLVRPDVLAPRLDVPAAVRVRTRTGTSKIVRYRAVAVDETDGVVTASCAPGSGTRFPAGRTVVSCSATDRAGNVARGAFAVVVRKAPVGVPPLWSLPDEARDGARDYASWSGDGLPTRPA